MSKLIVHFKELTKFGFTDVFKVLNIGIKITDTPYGYIFEDMESRFFERVLCNQEIEIRSIAGEVLKVYEPKQGLKTVSMCDDTAINRLDHRFLQFKEIGFGLISVTFFDFKDMVTKVMYFPRYEILKNDQGETPCINFKNMLEGYPGGIVQSETNLDYIPLNTPTGTVFGPPWFNSLESLIHTEYKIRLEDVKAFVYLDEDDSVNISENNSTYMTKRNLEEFNVIGFIPVDWNVMETFKESMDPSYFNLSGGLIYPI